jgi:hypothetical protein
MLMTHITKVHKFPSKLKGNSLHGELPTEVFENFITDLQASLILQRATDLYTVMVDNEEIIRSVYGEKTERLINNFAQILHHADQIDPDEDSEEYDNYFSRLSLFCGQVEQISKLLRYYKSL